MKADPRRIGFLLAMVSIWVPAGACRPKPQEIPAGVDQRVERGPLSLTATVSPKELLLGDALEVRLELTAPADYVAEFPQPGDLAPLAVRDQQDEPAQILPDGRMRWRQRTRVDALAPGTLEIPGLTVRYRRDRRDPQSAGADSGGGELTLPSMKAEVRSVLTAQDSPEQPRGVSGLLAPPPWRPTGWQVALMAAAALAAAGGGLAALRWWRRRRLRPAAPVPADLWALAALDRLGRRRLIDRGAVESFYFELSEIVRQYIERRFQVAAPKMTTQEFLTAVAAGGTGGPLDPLALRPFLESCDRVKYAAYEPGSDDASRSLSTARELVEQTR